MTDFLNQKNICICIILLLVIAAIVFFVNKKRADKKKETFESHEQSIKKLIENHPVLKNFK